MSIRIYLRGDIGHAPGFKQNRARRERGEYKGVEIFRDEDEQFYCVPTSEKTPRAIEQFVASASIRAFIPPTPHRTLGVYRDGETSITVDRGERDLRVNGTAKSIDALLDLYRAIRAGKIQPTDSWEAPMEAGNAPRHAAGV